MKSIFKIGGVIVEPPMKKDGPVIKLSFGTGKQQVSIGAGVTTEGSIINFDWVRENADILLAHHYAGRTFVGLPLEHGIEKGGQYEACFTGYFDFKDATVLSKRLCQVPAKEQHKIDWFNDIGDTKYWEDAVSAGYITPEMQIPMPYVIDDPNATIKKYITFLSIVGVFFQIQEEITKIKELAGEATSPFSWGVVIAIAERGLYIVFLILTLINLFDTLRELIIEPVKYHAVMKVRDLLQAAASVFGYTLDAEIFDTAPFKDLAILPEKYNIPTYSFDTGLFSSIGLSSMSISGLLGSKEPEDLIGYPTRKTIGQTINEICQTFCLKIIITEDQRMILLRQDKTIGTPQYQQPNVYNDGQFTTNATDLSANVSIEFLTDANDRNTIQNYKGTIYQVQTVLAEDVPIEQNFLSGLRTETLPFARLSRKNSLTGSEQIIKDFLSVVQPIVHALVAAANVCVDAANAVLDVARGILKVIDDISFGALTLTDLLPSPIPEISSGSLTAEIDNRIGMASIENDFVSVQKLFVIVQGSEPKYNKVHANNDTIVSAKNIWNTCYGPAISFLPSPERPNGNQYLIQKYTKVPLQKSDFDKLKANNSMYMFDGTPAIMEESTWDTYNLKADNTVKISHLYAPNLQEIYTEPTGR